MPAYQDVSEEDAYREYTRKYKAWSEYGQQRGDYSELEATKLEWKKYRDFIDNLAKYDKEADKFTTELRRGFRTSTELGAARAVRGAERDVGQYMARRGLSQSGLGGMGQEVVRGGLYAQAEGQRASFDMSLNRALQQQREGFVRGEFDFFKRLDTMRYQTDLNKEMAAFQAQLQRDLLAATRWERMLNLGARVLGSFVPFGPGVEPSNVGTGGGGGSYYQDDYSGWT